MRVPLHPRTMWLRSPLSSGRSSSGKIRNLIPHPLTPTTTTSRSHQPQPDPPIINLNILIQDPEPLIHHRRRQNTAAEVAGESLPQVVDDGRQRVAFGVEDADGAVVGLGPSGR